jgi:transposase InsO family protein
MRESGLAGVHARRRWRKARSGDIYAPDLVRRNFDPAGPDELQSADVTQFRTGEGWLYLAAVIDLWSRRAIGWPRRQLGHHRAGVPGPGHGRHPQGPAAARDPPLRPGSGLHVAGVLAANHRTRATSVTREDRRLLGNAAVEAFFATLKRELAWIHRTERWNTKDQLRSALFDYIKDFHNPQRIQQRLGHRSPIDFERAVSLKSPCPPNRVKPRALPAVHFAPTVCGLTAGIDHPVSSCR